MKGYFCAKGKDLLSTLRSKDRRHFNVHIRVCFRLPLSHNRRKRSKSFLIVELAGDQCQSCVSGVYNTGIGGESIALEYEVALVGFSLKKFLFVCVCGGGTCVMHGM